MSDAVDRLNLAPRAHAAALALLAAHSSVIFTSGRRDAADQARAMAANVIQNRCWIAETYRPTAERDQLQAWIDTHPEVTTKDAVADGLRTIMETWSDARRARLSRHFAGLAFDVRPVGGAAGAAIKASIRGLPGLVKFLEGEGGLVRWHAEFAP